MERYNQLLSASGMIAMDGAAAVVGAAAFQIGAIADYAATASWPSRQRVSVSA
jgi:hypothetical protein